MPVQNGLTYLKNKISGNHTFFTDINNLKQENQELKNKNSELEQSLRELANYLDKKFDVCIIDTFPGVDTKEFVEAAGKLGKKVVLV